MSWPGAHSSKTPTRPEAVNLNRHRPSISPLTHANWITDASFPHPFTHGEVFGLPDKCGEVGDPNLQEYPVEQGWMYNGTALNDTENFDRVVYLHTKGETDSLYNHPQATFCGVVTKTWAPGKGLVLCTWEGCCDP